MPAGLKLIAAFWSNIIEMFFSLIGLHLYFRIKQKMAENRQQSPSNTEQATTLEADHISAATVFLTHFCFHWTLRVLLLNVCF